MLFPFPWLVSVAVGNMRLVCLPCCRYRDWDHVKVANFVKKGYRVDVPEAKNSMLRSDCRKLSRMIVDETPLNPGPKGPS